MDFPCSPTMRAGALLLAIGATPAIAQTSRDAEAYPCARTVELAVVQSDAGFSIRQKANPAAHPPAGPPSLPAVIKLGNSLTIDGRLLARTSLLRPESSDVPQR